MQTNQEWRQYIKGNIVNLPKLPNDIPKKPEQVYSEWINWNTFLGVEVSKYNSNREFWPFEVARSFVHKLGLKRLVDWNAYCVGKFTNLPAKPIEIPSNPHSKYKNLGWKGYSDWLGKND